ncbi:MAG: DMT family transporter [Candidatus Thermoplasmatota archaeon]
MENKPYFGLFISIISVSFAAIFIKTINYFSPNIHPLAISFYRLFFTVLLVIPFFLLEKDNILELKKLSKNDLILIFFIGIILALHFSFWVTSLRYTSVASSVILVTSHPIIVGPISYFLLKEKLSLINSIGILFSVIGVIGLVYGNSNLYPSSTSTIVGNIFALLGGVAFGLYIVGARKVRKKISLFPYVLIIYSVATITLLIICVLQDISVDDIDSTSLFLIVLMAFISGILGHTLYNWSIGYIRASLASVALLGEPIISSFLALLIPWIAEVPTIYTVIGGSFVLFGIYLTSKKPSK